MPRQARTRATGYVELTGPEGTQVTETFTCCHCGNVSPTPAPGADETGFCRRCMARECLACGRALGGRCLPFEKQVEAYEKGRTASLSIEAALSLLD